MVTSGVGSSNGFTSGIFRPVKSLVFLVASIALFATQIAAIIPSSTERVRPVSLISVCIRAYSFVAAPSYTKIRFSYECIIRSIARIRFSLRLPAGSLYAPPSNSPTVIAVK